MIVVPAQSAIICTHLLPKVRGADSVDRLLILGGVDGVRIWTGTVWRPPPGKRGAVLHAALVEKPSCCIRRLGGRRSREVQFTRFLRNPSVTTDAMVGHAVELTAGRAAGRDIVVAQDTSELALGGPRARASGYGPVGKGGALGGLLLHAALALEVGSHALLGLVDAQIWNRDKGKAIARRSVRACRDRKIKGAAEDETELLFAHIDGLAETGRAGLEIAAAPGRKARKAELALRFSPVKLCKTSNIGACDLPDTIALTLVDVREVGIPEDGAPIHWRLLTTHRVTNLAEARRIIDLYRMRWTIEEFFRTLKTAGFDIEEADIGDPQVMIKFVAAVTVAAVTVMQLVKARDGTTDQQLADAFEPDDQPVLEALSAKLEGATALQKNPHPKGSLAFAAWVIARLGGWTGYYGKPGPKVMRRGLEDFRRIKFGTTLSLKDV